MFAKVVLMLTITIVMLGCTVVAQPETLAPATNLDTAVEASLPIAPEKSLPETDGRLIKERLEREAMNTAGAGLDRPTERVYPETDGRLIKERLEREAMQ